VFLKLFYSIAPFSFSTRRFCSPSLIKQAQGSKFKEFYLMKALNSWTKCWVRLASSTWNVSWLWNTNNKGFQLLQKQVKKAT